MNLRALIDASASRMQDAGLAFGHGTNNALDEAAWLVLWRLGLPLDTAIDAASADAARPVSASEQEACEALVGERISSRKPAAYLTSMLPIFPAKRWRWHASMSNGTSCTSAYSCCNRTV